MQNISRSLSLCVEWNFHFNGKLKFEWEEVNFPFICKLWLASGIRNPLHLFMSFKKMQEEFTQSLCMFRAAKTRWQSLLKYTHFNLRERQCGTYDSGIVKIHITYNSKRNGIGYCHLHKFTHLNSMKKNTYSNCLHDVQRRLCYGVADAYDKIEKRRKSCDEGEHKNINKSLQ